ncbi:MAG TPA: glycosyltransferase, partial [Fimbriimonadaceae bacterium]|nr:glycosyltransferase [Fimbriimonadaceae bacterium]
MAGKVKSAVAFCVHDDHWFLRFTIDSFRNAGDLYVFLSRMPWNGEAGDWTKVKECAEECGAKVILGDWPVEVLHRQAAVQTLIDLGYTHALMPDSDEIAEPQLVESLRKIIRTRLAQRVYVHMDTYWSRPDCIIRPRERLTPLLMMELEAVHPWDVTMFNGRLYGGGIGFILPPELGVLHHLSYVGPDARIQRKISTWSHSHEVVDRWWSEIWLGWHENKLMRDLHPTHPPVYGYVERIPRPDPLKEVIDYRAPSYDSEPYLVAGAPPAWPKVSIVIPLHGGPKEIDQCLESLDKLEDILHEVIVVDDASPDNAPKVAAKHTCARLLKNDSNLGFAATCNRGAAESSGEIILFLNSDTMLPRAGFIRLIQSLQSSGAIGAAGPVSNNVGYYQRINPTYSDPSTIDLFAEDLARSSSPDRDVEILVGFALAVKRNVWDEIGPFDERYERGMFEDTDYSYRLCRAGYRMVLAARAFVHHWGSRTLERNVSDPGELLQRNRAVYEEKWRSDIETGFASHLPGLAIPAPVQFNPSRERAVLGRQIDRLRKQARISLCMIVRDEERVLRACLESAKPFFHEMIVVDTGSTDGTVEIAKDLGATVFEIEWPDSFAEARNESLKHATGEWIFWLDADDTLPFPTGETILEAALKAPPTIAGFVVPIQFVDAGPGAGTRVDHVKLFRNNRGVTFEGRIHEQVLTSLRKHGEVARLEAVILHSGYDRSPEGQRKKRARDWHLLELDLAERPGHPFVLFNIGMTHHFSGNHAEAVDWLQRSISHSGPSDSHLRKAWAMMGVSLRELGRLDEAADVLRTAIGKIPDDPELPFQLGMTLTSMGRLLEAKQAYESMPTSTDGHFSSVDVGILTFKRLHNLGCVKQALGDYAGAKADWIEATRLNPGSIQSLVALIDAALIASDLRTAKQGLEDLLRMGGKTVDWADRRAKLAEAVGEPGGGVAAMQRELDVDSNAIGPRLVLSRALLGAQNIDAAIPHLEFLDRHNVAEAAFFLGVAAVRRGDHETA